MEENEDEPEDVRKATPVADEIKSGAEDEKAGDPKTTRKNQKDVGKSSRCDKNPKKPTPIKSEADCCRNTMKSASKTQKTMPVLVYSPPCSFPRLEIIPRHCLSKKEYIDILAAPRRECPSPCLGKTVIRNIRPISARMNELAQPARRLIVSTLQERGETLPPEMISNLVKSIEGSACLTPEQAEQYFRDKEREKGMKAKKNGKRKCRGKAKALECPSPLDKEAVMCQYLMAERFVKSILRWRCPIPVEEFKDIASVILRRLSFTLEYTPIDGQDLKSQQMRFLADIVACWISGVLFEVAEDHKKEIEEEMIADQEEEEEEEDEEDEEEEEPKQLVEEPDEDEDDEGEEANEKESEMKTEDSGTQSGKDIKEEEQPEEKPIEDPDENTAKELEEAEKKKKEAEEEENARLEAEKKKKQEEEDEKARKEAEEKARIEAEKKKQELEEAADKQAKLELQQHIREEQEEKDAETKKREKEEEAEKKRKEIEEEEEEKKRKEKEEEEEQKRKEKEEEEEKKRKEKEVEEAKKRKEKEEEEEKKRKETEEEEEEKKRKEEEEEAEKKRREKEEEETKIKEKKDDEEKRKEAELQKKEDGEDKLKEIGLQNAIKGIGDGELFKTELPFVTIGKILDTVYKMVEDEPEGDETDIIHNRIQRSLYEKLTRLIQLEAPDALTENLKDVVDVFSGKAATWVQRLLKESELNFLHSHPPEAESREIRDWGKWIDQVTDRAGDWADWIHRVVEDAESKSIANINRGDWQSWTSDLETKALLWRRYYLETVHQAHHNKMMVADRPVVKTGEKGVYSANEEEIKNTDLAS